MSTANKDVQIDMGTYHTPTDDWNDHKEDPQDKVPNVTSNNTSNPSADAPPTLTRRMSSQLSVHLERQTSVLEQSGMAGYIPDSIASHIPGFSRQKVLKATYFCNICFTKYPIDDGFKLRSCQHQFCVECIKGFFTNKINGGSIYLKCFHPMIDNDHKPCGDDIDEDDIHQLLDAEVWTKYEKFKSNIENTLSRQCPYCDHTQIGSKSTNIMVCNNTECGKQYCLYHSNAHDMDESCEAYELRTAKETKMNEMALQQMGDALKPCPQCEFRIIKNGGCNHMNCVKCGCSFCWLCMEVIEDTELPNHYKDENSQCKGQQFTGMDGGTPPIPIVLLMVLMMCIFCIPGCAMGLVFGFICHPCVVYCLGYEKDVLETICICTFIWMMIPVVIILSIVVMICKGIKAIYDSIQHVCTCLPSCPAAWIDAYEQ